MKLSSLFDTGEAEDDRPVSILHTRRPQLARGAPLWPRNLPRQPEVGHPATHQARLVEAIGSLAGAVGDMHGVLAAMSPVVLHQETILLDATGTAQRQFKVPYRSVSINYLGSGLLTVAAAPLGAAAPGPGPGVCRIGPGGYGVVNFSAYTLSLYGNPGDTIELEAYSVPMPPTGTLGTLTGLPAGPAGGFLSTSDYPATATPVIATSGNQANAAATATLPAVPGRTNYLTGFEVTGAGATAALVVLVTITGLVGGVTFSYTYAAALGVTIENTPLLVEFAKAIPASAVNIAISVSCPALGAGNTNNAVNAHGYLI